MPVDTGRSPSPLARLVLVATGLLIFTGSMPILLDRLREAAPALGRLGRREG